MGANLKVRLFKGKTYSDGTHPIQLQFYLNGKLKRKGIYTCHESDWDFKNNRIKSKVVNSSFVNNLISEKYTEHERELIKLLSGNSDGNDFFSDKKDLTLDTILEMEGERFRKENKPGSYQIARCYRKELRGFTDTCDLNISDIDLKWFQEYAAYLATEIRVGDKLVKNGNIGSSIQKKIKTIRSLVEKYSGKMFANDVKSFRVNTKKPIKQKLTPEELLTIEEMNLTETPVYDCVRDIFLLQIYLRGARIGSLLKAYGKQFKDGRYNAYNGSGKHNVGSKLIPKAQCIVDKYNGRYERLFPLFSFVYNPKITEFENKMIEHQAKKASTSLVNNYLKKIAKKAGITKPLSSHIARHTFARMAIDKINNPMVTMELLGHSSLAVHQAYLNDIRKDDVLDAAADDIFG